MGNDEIKKFWDRIEGLSLAEKGHTPKRFTKLMEEIGEFSSAYLKIDGFKVDKENLSPTELRNNFLEEGIDSLIMVIDILNKEGFSYDEIAKMFSLKLNAWENVLVQKDYITKEENQKKDDPIRGGELIQNALKYLKCGEIIHSISQHDYQTCSCTNRVMVDGGLAYSKRSYRDENLIEEYCLYNDSNFEEIKNKLLWGTHGIEGDKPLMWIPLSSCDSHHLNSILRNTKKINSLHKKVIKSILKDREIED